MRRPPKRINDHKYDFVKNWRNYMVSATSKVGLSGQKRLVGEETHCKRQQAYGNQ